MRTERNILIAFILNFTFSIFEFIGGMVTGSVSILSDALHDMGDAAGIGVSYFMEKKSKKPPDEKHTYGYARYSVLGGLITTSILLPGAAIMIFHAIGRIIVPAAPDYSGMILFSVIGLCVNSFAAFFTREEGSVNQKAVNLHMLEDVLGWAVVLAGAIVMRFTDFSLLDPIMSMVVSLFILVNAVKNLMRILSLLLEKVPDQIEIAQIKAHIEEIDGVLDVHHIHIWSMDGHQHYATLHAVTDRDAHSLKEKIRRELRKHGICHATIETEAGTDPCSEINCAAEMLSRASCGHHHHHH